MDSFGGLAPNEENAFEFNVTAAMVNNFMSDSMVPLVDAPEHRIMPLGEDEEDSHFSLIEKASGRSGLLLPLLSDFNPTQILIEPTKKKDSRLGGQRYNECGDGHIKCDAFTKEWNFR